MHVLYSSPRYHVIEYPDYDGLELINKQIGFGTFIQGDAASMFRASLASVIAKDPTSDSVDDFLGEFDDLMLQPSVYH